MARRLVIRVDAAAVRAAAAGHPLALQEVRGDDAPPAPAAEDVSGHRERSLSVRLVEWAERRGRAFTTADVERALGLTRIHAAKLLSRVVRGGGSVRRVAHGVYCVEGVEAEVPAYREGSRPRQLVEWAERRGRTFTTADVEWVLGVTRTHASMVLSRVVTGPGPVVRVSRGLYAVEGAVPAPARTARRKRRRAPTKKK